MAADRIVAALLNLDLEECDLVKELLTDYLAGRLACAGYPAPATDICLPVGIRLLRGIMERAPELFNDDHEDESEAAIRICELMMETGSSREELINADR